MTSAFEAIDKADITESTPKPPINLKRPQSSPSPNQEKHLKRDEGKLFCMNNLHRHEENDSMTIPSDNMGQDLIAPSECPVLIEVPASTADSTFHSSPPTPPPGPKPDQPPNLTYWNHHYSNHLPKVRRH